MVALSLFDLIWPLGVAVFVWWFSTGVVLMLDGLPRRTFRLSLGGLTLLAAAALVCLTRTAQHATVTAAYAAFLCALLVWAWIELSFLTGWVTGPSKQAATPGIRGFPRFLQAVEAIAWHELAIALLAVSVLALTWNAPNPVAAWTFLVLWIMRTSAKLNLFLGVRNTNEDWLPPHLAYLGSFFRRRPMNALFPLSVTGGTAVLGWLVHEALRPGTPPHLTVGLVLTAALLGLAVLEHWLLVLPLPSTWLWRWAMKRHGGAAKTAGSVTPALPPIGTDAATVVLQPALATATVHAAHPAGPAR